MKEPWKIITAFEADNSRLAKEAIVAAAAKEGNDVFFEGMNLAFNKLIRFGVKKVPTHGGPDGQGLPWNVFRKLADQLAARQLTGNDAKKAIELTMAVATKDQWNNWYKRILQKKLDCGVTEKTINNVVETIKDQYAVPVFGVQLAHDGAKHEKKMKGKKLLEVKLDGARAVTIVWPDGECEQFSRNGLELHNFGHIKQQFSKIAHLLKEPMVFDGEVMSSKFQDLMTQIRRKSNVKADDAVMYLFDIVPLKDFEEGYCAQTQKVRSKALKTFMEHPEVEAALTHCRLVGQEEVDLDTEAGQKRFVEINDAAIKGKYEGIMAKDPEAPYECKRTDSWLKLKPFIELDMTVDGWEEGTGKNVGKLGAFLMHSYEEDAIVDGEQVPGKIRVDVSCGGGYTDKQREEFWKHRKEAKGLIAEVRADAVTRNQDGTYSLRFPRFRRFRGFSPGQKI